MADVFTLSRRRLLLGGAGGAAVLCLAGGPLQAQTKQVAGVAPWPDIRPPRLLVQGAASPVQLRAVRISAEISGRLALTSVELEFFNPNARVLEGELQFPLLEGQGVVGMAMQVENGAMREAVVVDKARGEQVFEDVTRARIDPALLSQTQGDNYKLRVYPLPAQGAKRVVVRYAEQLAPQARPGWLGYRLPLAYAESLPELAVTIRVAGQAGGVGGGAAADCLAGGSAVPRASSAQAAVPAFVAQGADQVLDWVRRDVRPAGVLQVDVPGASGSVSIGEHRGRSYFVAQWPLASACRAGATAAPARRLPQAMALAWDASGSGAERDHGREFALLDAYFARARRMEVHLHLLRHVTEAPRTFQVEGGDWSALRRELEATAYDGATDLHAGLHPGVFAPAVGEVLLFSDGLSNFGDAESAPLTRLPLYAVLSSGRADATRLRSLAEARGGALIDLLGGEGPSTRKAVSLLLEQPTRLVRMESNGARQLVAASMRPQDGWLTIAGELTERRAVLRLELEHPGGANQRIELPLQADPAGGSSWRSKKAGVDGNASAAASGLAPRTWAQLRIRALQGEEALNRAEIRRLSRDFCIVTRETSLIILDRAEDYARFEIAPPPELAAEVAALQGLAQAQRLRETQDQLEQVVRRFERKRAWWSQGPAPAPWRWGMAAKERSRAQGAAASDMQRRESERMSESMPGSPPAMAPVPVAPVTASKSAAPMFRDDAAARLAGPADAAESRGNLAPLAKPSPDGQAGNAAVIRLRPAERDAPYLRRLAALPAAQLYRAYLDERASHRDSTAFFLDVAELLFDRGQHELAVRVLSNLAEMDLENRQVLRILAQRLLQADLPHLAVPLLRKVLAWAPHEPQSYRDLGLALAAAGEPQAAVDMLYDLVLRPWPRFPEVELIALAELNAIAAAPGLFVRIPNLSGVELRPKRRTYSVDTSRIDPRLRHNLPLDLRAVLSWDTDNTDIDLWVTDPSGEPAYFGRPLTRQGGRLSQDATGGYGPEEFSLRRAMPGTYRVEVQFYGHRQQVVSAATTVQLVLSTGFGTPRQVDRRVTLRLRDPRDRVLVGEFDVLPGQAD